MIRQLERAVIDRIAAGEVVERPASVVKELVENALDARATSIDVTIDGGGLGLVRVADDGTGIEPDDLLLAFAAHATSKLVDVDDLFHIVSFGFRGEALASIGAVSHARIVTSAADDGAGLRLDCDGGVVGRPVPVAARRGTAVEVRDLFYNTPARRRFLGATSTEGARCREVVNALSLVNPGVRFSVTVDGSVRFRGDGSSRLVDRVAAVYGPDLAESMVALGGRDECLALEGLVTLPGAARPRPRAQLVFVNGRLVRDKRIHAAVRTGCADFVPPSLQPAYVLMLTVDPERVDVNVHPTKAEVRFRDGEALHRLVRRAVREAHLRSDLAPRVTSEHVFGLPPAGTSPAAPAPAAAWPAPSAWPARKHPPAADPAWLTGLPTPDAAAAEPADDAHATVPSTPAALPLGPLRAARRFLQVLDTYLVHDGPEGLVLVDQHALHERVLYSRLQRDLAEGRIERQRLLVPHTARLSPDEHARCLELRGELAARAFEVEPFGPDTVAIQAVPAVLRGEDLDDLLRAMLDPPDVHGGIPDGLDRRLFTMACHAAVKAGDPLTEAEVEDLLRQGAELEHDATCPHGRPTRLVIGRTELERLFKRSGF